MAGTNTATRVGGTHTGGPVLVRIGDRWVNPYSVASITPVSDSESTIAFTSGLYANVDLDANSVAALLANEAVETPARHQFTGIDD